MKLLKIIKIAPFKMFRATGDPSSGIFIQCLAKISVTRKHFLNADIIAWELKGLYSCPKFLWRVFLQLMWIFGNPEQQQAGLGISCFLVSFIFHLSDWSSWNIKSSLVFTPCTLTKSLNRQTNTCTLLIFYLLKYILKFLKTILHVSVIRPSSGSL